MITVIKVKTFPKKFNWFLHSVKVCKAALNYKLQKWNQSHGVLKVYLKFN